MEPIRINSEVTTNYQDNTNNSPSTQYLRPIATCEGDTFVSSTKKPRRSFLSNLLGGIRSFFGGAQNQVQNIEVQKAQAVEPIPVTEELYPEVITEQNINTIIPTWIYEPEPEDLPETEMSVFLTSPDYDKKIKEACQGKYQQELLQILSSATMDKDTKKELARCGLTEEQFLDAIRKLSKSTFKAAMNKPTQYINYTQDPQYQMFVADSYCKGIDFPDDESRASGYMTKFFSNNLSKLVKALQYVDTDTLNQMMDKRSTGFIVMLDMLDRVNPENGELLKDLISQVRKGDARQKIKLCQLVEIFQSNGFDMNVLKSLGEEGEIDSAQLNDLFKSAILKKAGVDENASGAKTDFNEDYFHLLFSRTPVRSNGAPYMTYDFDDLVRETSKGNFDSYILDESNKHGIANKNTKNAFLEQGLNYEQWLHPDIENREFNVGGKKMSLKLWDRNPYEDLFLGNKTRCCTAIATGSNSAAMPIYLLNTSFNYIELTDDKNNVKGMARIYMSQANDKPSVVIDSIELTDIKQMSDEEKARIAGNIFKYAKQFGQTITNRPTDVYYLSEDSKLALEKKYKTQYLHTEFIGDISAQKVYTNSNSSGRWRDLRGTTSASYYIAA